MRLPHARRARWAGLIVQDVGLASRLRAVAPSLPLHASTQMSISDADGAKFAAQTLGARTVVLTRELSIDDIAAVTAAVPEANVEVFVHGHMWAGSEAIDAA